MTFPSKSVNTLAVIDTLIILSAAVIAFINTVSSPLQFTGITLWLLAVTLFILYSKGFYNPREYTLKDIWLLFESITVSTAVSGIPLVLFSKYRFVMLLLLIICAAFIFFGIIAVRVIYLLYLKLFKTVKNTLIVGAGQDGKLIAEKIQERPELGLKVVGFLDDNMNTIEDEDSTVPVLGLTCDTEAVVKDNNVKLVIIAVKTRMNANTLTDLIRGIPTGVKVWRMPKFYEKITRRYLVSKMTVNWLFYKCVRKQALFYSYFKRICDIIFASAALIITSPLSIIAMAIIKLSDLGPVFFCQTRIGMFGKPFKMIKFRTMYQDKVEENFDDDLNEVKADDKRIMPFCKILRKFRIDEIPQMINVLRGEMSLIGPRAVREEIYYENKEKQPFWECRNWVRPGWCGWQQLNCDDPHSEDRLEYDLYYIKHRNLLWELAVFIRYVMKICSGRCN